MLFNMYLCSATNYLLNMTFFFLPLWGTLWCCNEKSLHMSHVSQSILGECSPQNAVSRFSSSGAFLLLTWTLWGNSWCLGWGAEGGVGREPRLKKWSPRENIARAISLCSFLSLTGSTPRPGNFLAQLLTFLEKTPTCWETAYMRGDHTNTTGSCSAWPLSCSTHLDPHQPARPRAGWLPSPHHPRLNFKTS